MIRNNIGIVLKCLFCLACSFIVGKTQATWRAVYYDTKVIFTHYDIHNESICKKSPIYSLNSLVAFTDKGLCISKFGKLTKNVADSLNVHHKIHYFTTIFNQLNCKKDTTKFYISIFLKNVKSYVICLQTSNGQWHKREFKCDFEGYQIPQKLTLSKWVDGFQPADGTINQMVILINPITLNEKIDFVVSELRIVDEIEVEQLCQHPFLDKLFNKVGNCDTILTANCLLYSNDDLLPLLCTEETYGMQRMSNYFNFKNDLNESEVVLLKDIIRLAIEEYPFYQERNLEQQIISKRFTNFCLVNSDTMSVQTFTKLLALFIRQEFKDAHFFIDPPEVETKETTSGPIRLYEIAGKVLVAGIFDTLYQNIPLGAEIITIDGKQIKTIIDSLSVFQLGQPERRRMRAIATSLYRNKHDSTIITFKKNNQIGKAIIRYNRKINIPQNFKAAHYQYEFIDSIAYFNINQMDSYVFLRLFNHIEHIKTAKGLILDLRGNPGGSSSEGEKIFSMFIDRPTVYHHVVALNRINRFESRMIRPNNEIHFPADYPVVIIGDENTACASEDFIQAMKQLKQCYYVSHSHTSGALQSRYGITFPSGAFLSLDCLTNKIYSSEVGVVEGRGIAPNVWVQPTKVSDLAPYDDLLKKASIKIVSSKFW